MKPAMKGQEPGKPPSLVASADRVIDLLGDAGDYRFSTLPSSVDQQLIDLLGGFEQASEADRWAFATGLGEMAGYALLAFAERMSMLSVRRKSEELLRAGSLAVVLAVHRIDPRMGLMILSLLHRSAERMSVDPESVFRSALEYAVDPSASDLVLGFLARDPQRKDIRAMGFKEIEGPSGLIYWQGGPRPIPEGLK